MKTQILFGVLFLLLAARGAQANCQASELSLKWPVSGADAHNFVINNYVDLDPGPGVKDYRGGSKTYDGHNGIDIDIPNFRDMERGRVAFAAAPGVVKEVEADLFDHNFERPDNCGPWNHVYVQTDNGFVTWYGHLKFGSTLVKVGDRVDTDTPLGQIGSAGCSTTAHLHFEVHDCADKVVDPMLQNMFTNPPVYDTPLGLMDITLRKGPFPNTNADAVIKDPPPNLISITPGSTLGVGLSLAGGTTGDTVDARVINPDGSLYNHFKTITVSGPMRHWWPRWWVAMPKPMAAGNYRVEIRLNNQLVMTKSFHSQPTPDAVVYAKTDAAYQEEFNSLTSDGYTPIIVDGSEAVEGRARFTAIFRYQYGPFRAFHNLDDAGYAAAYQSARAAGLQLTSLDNYMHDGQPRIAAVFSTPITSNWIGFHFQTREQHQANFENFRAQGYRPYIISVAVGGGRYWISSAYTKTPSRGWTARYDMTIDDYQQEFDRQKAAGRALDYINIYQDGATPKVSAIWTAEANDWPWEVHHDLEEVNFFAINETEQLAGYTLRGITSYMKDGKRLYAAIWRKGPV